jgi:DNA segregation ATPase FtsK/SpoIIIE-like protein
VYPIFATNDPSKSAVVAKSNLSTRISFFVISSSDSIMGFGRPGANKLPKVQGRGLIISDARVTEFQAFTVDYPKPTEAGMKWLENVMQETEIIEPTALRDEIAALAEGIRGQWNAGLSGSAVARLLGLSQYGGSYKQRVDKVVEYLTSTLYSTTPKEAENPVFGAV